eukprot:4697635-Lingulodinium_polyedra.AAC.1
MAEARRAPGRRASRCDSPPGPRRCACAHLPAGWPPSCRGACHGRHCTPRCAWQPRSQHAEGQRHGGAARA